MNGLLESILNNPSAFWFVVGFSLLAIEVVAFGLGSGVLLFGSIGALITGALLHFEVIPANWIISVASFAIASALATAVLWMPLKRLQSGAELGNDRSSDLIGYQFRLDSTVTPTNVGTHRYSGIHWQVRISDETSETTLNKGSSVRVAGVDPGVFHVVPI